MLDFYPSLWRHKIRRRLPAGRGNCGQGVGWNVLASSITLSAKQIEDFRKIFPGEQGNRRPVQPLNGRVVVTDVQPE